MQLGGAQNLRSLPGSRSHCRGYRLAALQEFRRPASKATAGKGVPASPVPTSKLRLLLDSATQTQIELWSSTGIFHGITTNPVILKRDGVKCSIKSLTALARSAFELRAQEVQLQAWGSSVAELSSIAYDLAGIDPQRIVVKLPATLEGVQVASLLRESNVRVTLTGLYAAHQVLVAQAVGAEYAAPYLGRMNDAYGADQGTVQVIDMQRMLDACQARTRLLVASVRDASDLSRLAAAGCNTFTISPKVAAKLFNNNFTIDAVAEFAAAALSNGGEEDLIAGSNLNALRLAGLRSSTGSGAAAGASSNSNGSSGSTGATEGLKSSSAGGA